MIFVPQFIIFPIYVPGFSVVIDSETRLENIINLETRLFISKYLLTCKRHVQLENITMYLETSRLIWKHHYLNRRVMFRS